MHHLVLSPELSAAVRPLARREGVTPFMTLLAAFQLVLGRWSGQDDFAVGAPVANRTRPETERLIGYFVNMIALRADLPGNPTVREFLARVREVALEAFENQEIPLEVLIPALGPRRDASRSPLFQVMFVLQNNAIAGGRLARPGVLATRSRPGDRYVEVRPLAGIRGHARRASPARWSSTPICSRPRRSSGSRTQYVKVLEDLIADPERPLSELSLLSDAERRQVVAWSRAPVGLPGTCRRRPIGLRLQPSTARSRPRSRATPDALALVAGDERLTYADIERARESAGASPALRGRGPGSHGSASSSTTRSIRSWPCSACSRQGRRMFRWRPSLPRTRLGGHAGRCARLDRDRRPRGRSIAYREPGRRSIDLDADRATIAAQSPEDPSVRVDGENLAYVIFTSGSTGRPKGVMVSHREPAGRRRRLGARLRPPPASAAAPPGRRLRLRRLHRRLGPRPDHRRNARRLPPAGLARPSGARRSHPARTHRMPRAGSGRRRRPGGAPRATGRRPGRRPAAGRRLGHRFADVCTDGSAGWSGPAAGSSTPTA